MDLSKPSYTTSPTLQKLEKLADNTNEAQAKQGVQVVQNGVTTSRPGKKYKTTKGIVASLWGKFINYFNKK